MEADGNDGHLRWRTKNQTNWEVWFDFLAAWESMLSPSRIGQLEKKYTILVIHFTRAMSFNSFEGRNLHFAWHLIACNAMSHYVHGLHTLDIPPKKPLRIVRYIWGQSHTSNLLLDIMDLQTKSITAISIFQVPTDVPSPTQGTSVTLVTSQLVRWIPSRELTGGDMLNFRRVKHQHMVDFPWLG